MASIIRVGGSGGMIPKFPLFTGQHAIFGNEKKGYMEMYSNGTFTPQVPMVADIFLVGGGGGGFAGANTTGPSISEKGAGGGYTTLVSQVSLVTGNGYPVKIGTGGSPGLYTDSRTHPTTPTSGGMTSFGPHSAAGGQYNGDGGSGGGGPGLASNKSSTNAGAGGSNGSNGRMGTTAGGSGQGTSTQFNGKTYAGGGGGGGTYFSGHYAEGGAGGAGGGGKGGSNSSKNGQAGTPRTGSGGGAGMCQYGANGWSVSSGGAGGSGIAIVRWGY